MPARGIIFETVVNGAIAKVSAIDVATGIEGVVVGPAILGESQLRQAAMRKLERLLKKVQQEH